MKDHPADLTLPRPPAPRPRATSAVELNGRLTEYRVWATRQAARTYGHLPLHLRAEAVNDAIQALRTAVPAGADRRTVQAELATELTASLRRVHVGWCLSQSTALLREQGVPAEAPPTPPTIREQLVGFVDRGLGGLERAVLQLEIGAGRDSRTVRAALRLGPRQYARHREEGLSKLRDAIAGQVAGHVCDDHVAKVVLAATGDPAAAQALAGGTTRCRSCSREAQGLRRLLNERLALAPFPIAIKPAGFLAAKLGALGAAFGGKAGTGATAVVAATAVATGGVALVNDDRAPVKPAAKSAAAAAPAAAVPKAIAETKQRTTGSAKRTAAAKKPATKKQADGNRASGTSRVVSRQSTPSAPTASETAPTTAAATVPAATVPSTQQREAPSGSVEQTVHDTVGGVRETVNEVTAPISPELAKPVDETLAAAQETVDQVTGTVDGLLAPPK